MNEIEYNANTDNSYLSNFYSRKHKGKLIAIEGLDSCGKSSQVKLITKYLESKGKTCIQIHFPMYGQNEFAEVISAFLRGEFGDVDEVDPLFVANIYAMDRYKYKTNLLRYLDEYDYVILDRYVFSNMAFQGAKYEDNEKKQSIIKWINDFEFRFLFLPYPELIIYFDLPIDVIKERLEANRVGDDRNYLNGGSDIHEKSLDLQTNVRNIYLGLTDFPNYNIINCIGERGEILTPENLFNTYKEIL